ncbi:MAG: hypothetical protein HY828_13525 [Actinobacteria bacterium]|nr:hypothetical protein [Actinomycetota bacterium]
MNGPRRQRIRARSRVLRQAIDALDYLASGTLLTRTKVCGRATCRCAVDPAARHGPYYEWTRRSEGRLVHYVVSADQAQLIALAINNHRAVQRLLAAWERETAAEILQEEVAAIGRSRASRRRKSRETRPSKSGK